jgi:hypothetical protein
LVFEKRPERLLFPILSHTFQGRHKRKFIYNEESRTHKGLTEILARGDQVASGPQSLIVSKFAILKKGHIEKEAASERNQYGNLSSTRKESNHADPNDPELERSPSSYHMKQPAYQIMSSPDFLLRMMTRQNDSSWAHIKYISTVMLEDGENWKVYRFCFIFDEYYEDIDLFVKAKDYIKGLLDSWTAEEVEDDRIFCEELKADDELRYIQYTCFKIVWFHEMALMIRLSKALFEFSKDEKGNFWLFNASNIHHRSSLDKNYDRFVLKKVELKDEKFAKEE